MDKDRFYFKQFSVSHVRSAIKVGVDGVLIGAWCNCRNAKHILDVGTGCGVIALMLAQRNSMAQVLGVDIDPCSLAEAEDNISVSPWSDRVRVEYDDFCNTKLEQDFDLIVSNPPFFRSGVDKVDSARLAARHQESLPLSSLIDSAYKLLSSSGRFAIVLPLEFESEIIARAANKGMSPIRICRVRGHLKAPYKRLLIEMQKSSPFQPEGACVEEELTLETTPGNPTDSYRCLCGDFYLRF